MKNGTAFIGALIIMLIGIGTFSFGAVESWEEYSFAKSASKTQGTVSVLIGRPLGPFGRVLWFMLPQSPVVYFSPPSGKPNEFTSDDYSFKSGYSIGDKVDVLYDPNDPQKAEIDTSHALYGMPIKTIAIGCLEFLFGMYLMFLGRKREQESGR